ncbi:aminotransferase class V-fold PLP-dependent enzyme [Aquiflexum sp.]|uniref:aminotransferase class V-fold PLP-dependent enzyme n=1 Tax=Aquiflexum sp. TaxID=1872584 RepID=UPI0035948913
MKLKNQKELFQLPEDIHYLNGAYMSPLLRSVEEAGITALIKKRNPTQITPADFFSDAEILRKNFGKLVNCPAEQVAIIPSASYGLTSAIQNLPKDNGTNALVVSDEFPSGYYAIEKWCQNNDKHLKVIKAPESMVGRGQEWNKQIIDSINDDTAVILMSSIHWTDGTLFDLKAIGKKCKAHNALFIVDGTQSVGALAIDVVSCQIDALVCAGYKWLMGPYSIGLAYYSEFLNNGSPLEESWMNRSNAQKFSSLTKYVDDYSIGAGRYNMGEFSNFNLLPMLNAAIEQILKWDPSNIQSYCDQLSQPLVRYLNDNGFWVEVDDYRAKHLFGIVLPEGVDSQLALQKFEENRIFVSVRGKAIRISMHLFNTDKDIASLIRVLKGILTEKR